MHYLKHPVFVLDSLRCHFLGLSRFCPFDPTASFLPGQLWGVFPMHSNVSGNLECGFRKCLHVQKKCDGHHPALTSGHRTYLFVQGGTCMGETLSLEAQARSVVAPLPTCWCWAMLLLGLSCFQSRACVFQTRGPACWHATVTCSLLSVEQLLSPEHGPHLLDRDSRA